MPGMDDNARTQAVPSLDDLLQQDRATHAERGGAPMPEGEDEDVAAPTEAIDFQALIASGAVPDPAAIIDASRNAENLATTPLDDGPHPVASSMGAPPAPAPMADAPGGSDWAMGGDAPAPPPDMGGPSMGDMGGGMGDMGGGSGGGASAPPPAEKSKTGLIIGILGALLFLFCCCPLLGWGGWSGFTYYHFQSAGSDPTAVSGEGGDEGGGDEGGGGALGSLTADSIKKVLEDEGYTIPTDPVSSDVGGSKTVAISGLKDTTVASVVFYSYDGPGASTVMDSWKTSSEGIDGSHVIVDGNAGLQVTVSGNADEAKRLAEKITGG